MLNYLRAGSPTVLVNLWDVTDKDIDRFTDVVFEKIGLWPLANIDDAKFELSEAVGQARSVCLLRHLNGAAPVVYGLPFKWPSRRL